MGITIEVEKKSSVKARHEEAIIEYKAWLEDNPNASLKRKFRQFDLFMDTAFLRSRLQ